MASADSEKTARRVQPPSRRCISRGTGLHCHA